MQQPLEVLHVEDEDDIAELVRQCLEPEGFHITWVRTQEAARAFFGELDRFSGAIVDGNVFGSTIPLIDDLRQRLPRPKFLFALTGEHPDVLKEMILKHGCDWGLAKPFRVPELLQWFRHFRDALIGAATPT